MKTQPVIEKQAVETASCDTKERLLDAAIRVFSKNGFQASSMRTITREAGTSLSAANYHFGTKEELLRAALRARAELLNSRRIELLEEAGRANGDPLSVEAVLDAFMRPVFERQAAMMAQDRVPSGLAMRLYLDPLDVISRIRHEVFESTHQRFAEALVYALPASSPESAHEALRFVLGVLVYAVSEWNEGGQPAAADPSEIQSRLEGVVTFSSAGVRALVTSQSFLSSDRGEMS